MRDRCPESPRARRRPLADLAVLAALWIAAAAIVNPLGDFPLNDDWSYGRTVRRMVEQGEYRPGGWTSMPLLTHALWGTLFCSAGGVSFTVLRFSTLALGLVGVVATYLLLVRLSGSRLLAFTGAFATGFNPTSWWIAS